ncbi:hypothetical protein GOP47_0024985 [Adiantum capillus-veneris]|uniref:WW domain-containing protein n=1 Tax=Adiantum capillus-veneris TaxID=13818 RepID=A0A9D4Z452_ADICA|nr:hypothetical protein GOP47_0024985 [Adiantum capillus-veneris]
MYSDRAPGNHDYPEALQPRLSFEKTSSSSNSMSNTTINDVNTACSIGSTPHDIVSNSIHNTAAMAAAIACTNTASSAITTANDIQNNPTAGGIGFNTTSCGLLGSDDGGLTSGFQVISAGEHLVSNTSSPRLAESCLDSATVQGGPCKRKRDWMNSLAPPDNYGKNVVGSCKGSSSLLTSVKITNGLYSFPAGWEQYLDLQTGETYYVNWNTRTKHCRVQCPEVQRCLAGVQQQQRHYGGAFANVNAKLNSIATSPCTSAKESVESWLTKMTAATSALVNNKPSFLNKPPLPPTTTSPRLHYKSSPNKQPHQGLDLSIKRLASSNHSTLTTLLEAHDTMTTPLPTSTHDSQSPMFGDFPCFNPATYDLHVHNSLLSPSNKSYHNNPPFESPSTNLDVASTANVDPLAFVCSNCNNLVLTSSALLPSMQCPNCNHSINKWSEDITSSPCDMPLTTALPLLEASNKAARCQ